MMRVIVKDYEVVAVDRAYNINDILDAKVSLQDRLATYESVNSQVTDPDKLEMILMKRKTQ